MDNDEGQQTNYSKGFTLIELLAVIVILSILMSIAVVSVFGIASGTNRKGCL